MRIFKRDKITATTILYKYAFLNTGERIFDGIIEFDKKTGKGKVLKIATYEWSKETAWICAQTTLPQAKYPKILTHTGI